MQAVSVVRRRSCGDPLVLLRGHDRREAVADDRDPYRRKGEGAQVAAEPPGVRHQVERPGLVYAEGDFGLAALGSDLAGGRTRRDARRGPSWPRSPERGRSLRRPKGDASLVEQKAQALVADVVDYHLGGQEVGRPGQTSRQEGQVVLGRLRLGDLLDLMASGQRGGLRPTAGALGVERIEAVGVEAVDHISEPGRHWCGFVYF